LALLLLLVAVAELLLDRLELLPQEVLALGLVDLRPHVLLDLGAQLEHFELAREDTRQLAQALLDVGLLERCLSVGVDAHRAGGEGEGTRLLDVGRRHLEPSKVGHDSTIFENTERRLARSASTSLLSTTMSSICRCSP
jgi:hypothetical protein